MLKRVIIVTRRGEKKPIIQVGNKGSVTNKTHFPSQRKPKKSGRFVKRRKRKKPQRKYDPIHYFLSSDGDKNKKIAMLSESSNMLLILPFI